MLLSDASDREFELAMRVGGSGVDRVGRGEEERRRVRMGGFGGADSVSVASWNSCGLVLRG